MARHPLTDRLYQEVGARVRELREGVGMTQMQLAESIGTARSTVANLEAGKQRIPLDSLLAIADRFAVEPRELLPTRAELAAFEEVPVAESTAGTLAETPATTRLIADLLTKHKERGDAERR